MTRAIVLDGDVPAPAPERPAGERVLDQVGLLTIEGHQALVKQLKGTIHVELDGAELPEMCVVEANDVEGWVDRYKMLDGFRFPPVERYYGTVRFILRAPKKKAVPLRAGPGVYLYGGMSFNIEPWTPF